MSIHALLPAAARAGDPGRAGRLILTPGALREGHFRLLGDLHTDAFLAFSAIARERTSLDLIAGWLAPSIAAWSPTALLAPSTAGVGLASSISRMLEIPLHLAELDGTGRPCGVIGGEALSGERVALVNDVVTTGQGLTRLKDVAEVARCSVVGASWFISRQTVDVRALLDVHTVHVLDLVLPAWPSANCELCASAVELEDALDLN